MTEFSHIQSIQTLESLDKSKSQHTSRGLLQLRVAGSSELLTVTNVTRLSTIVEILKI